MNVGVVVAIVVVHGLQHRQRLLRGSGVVQIDQRLAVDFLEQDGKILTHFFHIKRAGSGGGLNGAFGWTRHFGSSGHPTSSQTLSTWACPSPENFAVSGKHTFSMISRR